MKTNQDYKNESLDALKGNWAPAVLATVIFCIIIAAIETPNTVYSMTHPVTTPSLTSMFTPFTALDLLYFLIALPLGLGYANAMLALLRKGERDITSNMFKLGFAPYWKKVWSMLLMNIYIILWSLLFLIPGIIKSFSYAMTPFIVNDEPELSAEQAIKKSMAMMKGHKFDLFYLYLSFIGWFLLSMLTCFIGLIWLIPYCEGATASFYKDRKEEFEAKEVPQE